MSPSSDIVGPSPVTSNGTETTEIEDEEVEETEEATGFGRNSVCGPCLCLLYDIVPVIITNGCQLLMLKTNIPDHVRRSGSEEVVSVIHAPPNFQDWV